MTMGIPLRHLGLTTLLAVFLPATATGQEAPCKERIIKICETDGENAICKILQAPDKPETAESILSFLNSISGVDDSIRKDLICARLMGVRTIAGLQIKIDYLYQKGVAGEDSRYVFTVQNKKILATKYRWRLRMPNEYIRLVETHRELDRLNRPANKDMTLTFEGMIVNVDASYYPLGSLGKVLSQVDITIDSVVPLQIITPYSTGDIQAQVRAAQEKVKVAYEEYMTTGFN